MSVGQLTQLLVAVGVAWARGQRMLPLSKTKPPNNKRRAAQPEMGKKQKTEMGNVFSDLSPPPGSRDGPAP